MPVAHHVGSLDAWLELHGPISSASMPSNGSGMYQAQSRSRGSNLATSSRAALISSAVDKGVGDGTADYHDASVGCQRAEHSCSSGLHVHASPFSRTEAAAACNVIDGKDPESSIQAFERSSRPFAGLTKRQSLLSLQLRSAISVPLDARRTTSDKFGTSWSPEPCSTCLEGPPAGQPLTTVPSEASKTSPAAAPSTPPPSVSRTREALTFDSELSPAGEADQGPDGVDTAALAPTSSSSSSPSTFPATIFCSASSAALAACGATISAPLTVATSSPNVSPCTTASSCADPGSEHCPGSADGPQRGGSAPSTGSRCLTAASTSPGLNSLVAEVEGAEDGMGVFQYPAGWGSCQIPDDCADGDTLPYGGSGSMAYSSSGGGDNSSRFCYSNSSNVLSFRNEGAGGRAGTAGAAGGDTGTVPVAATSPSVEEEMAVGRGRGSRSFPPALSPLDEAFDRAASSSLPDLPTSGGPPAVTSLSNTLSSPSHSQASSLAVCSASDLVGPATTRMASFLSNAGLTKAGETGVDDPTHPAEGAGPAAVPDLAAAGVSSRPAPDALSLSVKLAAAVETSEWLGSPRKVLQGVDCVPGVPAAGSAAAGPLPSPASAAATRDEAGFEGASPEMGRRSRGGGKGVSFASLFSTVLVLPSDDGRDRFVPAPPAAPSRVAPAVCSLDRAPAHGLQATVESRVAWAHAGPAQSRSQGHARDARGRLQHCVSLSRAERNWEEAAAAISQPQDGSGDPLDLLMQLRASTGSARSSGGGGAGTTSSRGSITGLLSADIEPAMYEGTVRRGFPRKAALARALSQPVPKDVFDDVLMDGEEQ